MRVEIKNTDAQLPKKLCLSYEARQITNKNLRKIAKSSIIIITIFKFPARSQIFTIALVCLVILQGRWKGQRVNLRVICLPDVLVQ